MNIESISNKEELKECIHQINMLIAHNKIEGINEYKAMGLRVHLIQLMEDIDYEHKKEKN